MISWRFCSVAGMVVSMLRGTMSVHIQSAALPLDGDGSTTCKSCAAEWDPGSIQGGSGES